MKRLILTIILFLMLVGCQENEVYKEESVKITFQSGVSTIYRPPVIIKRHKVKLGIILEIEARNKRCSVWLDDIKEFEVK